MLVSSHGIFTKALKNAYVIIWHFPMTQHQPDPFMDDRWQSCFEVICSSNRYILGGGTSKVIIKHRIHTTSNVNIYEIVEKIAPLGETILGLMCNLNKVRIRALNLKMHTTVFPTPPNGWKVVHC